MLKFLLMPVALIGALFAAMSAHIFVTTAHHRTAWLPTTANVVRAETLCAVTYQPADAVLRETAAIGPCDTVGETALPAGGSKPRVFEDVYGALIYEIGGRLHNWEGKLAEIGVYNVTPGETVALLYDPADPTKLDTAMLKGWFGGTLILLLGGGFFLFYCWHFWLRRR